MNEPPSNQDESHLSQRDQSQRDELSGKSKTGWVLLLPLALLGGALLMRGGGPQPGPVNKEVPVIATPAPAIVTPAPARLTQAVIFVPDENAELRAKTITLSEGLTGKEAAFAEVEYLLNATPDAFPKGTRVLGIVTAGDTVQVNFNRAFADKSFWQGSARTTNGSYAIVNTLTRAQNGFTAKRVQFLVEGKPLEQLGELDVSEPLEANMGLVKH